MSYPRESEIKYLFSLPNFYFPVEAMKLKASLNFSRWFKFGSMPPP
jgi:hypothetical protein